jgi:hypothetical protein
MDFRVVEQQHVNAMSVHNLAVIFGPTLFGTPSIPAGPVPNGHGANGTPTAGGGAVILDMGAQNKV